MKIELGKFNTLQITKTVDFGIYLDGEDYGEILLPSRYVPAEYEIGDWLDVFLYLDNEERLIATTLTPYAQVGEFAYLEVAWVNEYGAFLNWGLMKDLFVPFREQKMKMQIERGYIVHVHLDEESFRIVASAKVERYLSQETPTYEPGEKVNILIWQKTDLGFKAIVDNKFSGLLYDNEIFQEITTGMKPEAYIKQVRPDGKIDLMLQKAGPRKVDDFSSRLLQYINDEGGSTHFNDKSDSNDIYDTFGVSKKVFKKAVGDLYKKRLIEIKPDGIHLAKPEKR